MSRLIFALVVSFSMPVLAQGTQEAGERFEKGVGLFKSEDYVGALVEFKAAYAAAPHFSVRYNLGITLYHLHRYVEAQEQFLDYLEEGGDEIASERKEEVERLLEEIGGLVGTVEIECDVEGAELLIDGMPSPMGVIHMDVGEYKLKVTAPGHKPFFEKIDVPGGKTITVTPTLVALGADEPEPEPKQEPGPGGKKKLPKAAFFTMMSLTLAAGVGTAITGGLTIAKSSDYEGLTVDSPDWRDVRKQGKNMALATDVLLGVGGALAVTTIVMAIFTDFSKAERKVALLASPSSLMIRGVF